MTIITGDYECTQDTDPANPGCALVTKLFKRSDNVGLTGSAYGQFCQQKRKTKKQNNEDINQQKCAASAFIGATGKFPDVPKSNG